MRKTFTLLLGLFLAAGLFAQNLSPHTVSMDAGTNNATAFGSAGQIGTDGTGIAFFVHWDASYLYLGWSGGRTTYSSDMYYAAIDTDGPGSGSNAPFNNAGFNHAAPDYLVFYENTAAFHGLPPSRGNHFEVWTKNGAGGWVFINTFAGNNNVDSRIAFLNSDGEVRVRIAWSSLGFTPGDTAPLGITMWNNNANANFVWAGFPTENPGGGTPQTLTHKFAFPSTGDNVNPSAAFFVTEMDGALPVELTSFEARVAGGGVQLAWTTASEQDNSHFEVERSLNGSDWATLGRVAGAGNSSSPRAYAYTDAQPANGTNYYRLRQVDRSGSFAYSHIVSAKLGQGAGFRVSPNPTKGHAQILFGDAPAEALVSISTATGQIVKSYRMAQPRSSEDLDLSELPAGLYLLSISIDGQAPSVQKVMKH